MDHEDKAVKDFTVVTPGSVVIKACLQQFCEEFHFQLNSLKIISPKLNNKNLPTWDTPARKLKVVYTNSFYSSTPYTGFKSMGPSCQIVQHY